MGRGRLLKTKVREAKAIEKARWSGFFEALEKAGQPDNVKESMQDLIAKIDPVELIAIVGMTQIISVGIDWTETAFTGPELDEKFEILKTVLMPILSEWGADNLIEWIKEQTGANEAIKAKLDDALKQPASVITQYLISFTVAYLVVHHFDAVMSLGSNLLGAAKMLMGFSLIPVTP